MGGDAIFHIKQEILVIIGICFLLVTDAVLVLRHYSQQAPDIIDHRNSQRFQTSGSFFYFLKLFPLPQILTKQFTLVITYQALFFMDDW